MTPPQQEIYNQVLDSHVPIYKKQRIVKHNGYSLKESYMDPAARALQQKQMAELWSVITGTHAAMSEIETGKAQWLRANLVALLGETSKIAVFFKYLATLNRAKDILNSMGIETVMITGAVSAADREFAMEAMNDGTARVLLGTSRSCGYGINLLSIDKIVLAEVDWNQAIDAQTAARGSRPGNPNAVSVFRLVTPDSIETVADTIAAAKITLARLVLDDKIKARTVAHAAAVDKARTLTQDVTITSFNQRTAARAFHFQS